MPGFIHIFGPLKLPPLLGIGLVCKFLRTVEVKTEKKDDLENCTLHAVKKIVLLGETCIFLIQKVNPWNAHVKK